MDKKDYYEVLGISRSADDNDIKSAYRKLAMKYHPDRNPGDKTAEENFKEATEAYEVLKDPQKRQMYDQFGHAGLSGGGGFEGFGGFGGFDLSDALRAFMRDFGSGGGFDFGFGDFFGGGRSERRNRGEDLKIRVALTLEEIAEGVEKKIKVARLGTCDDCNGSGAAPGHSLSTCPECRGQGQVRTISKTFLGTVQQVRTCSRCRGAGEIIAQPCHACRGEGRVREMNTVKVKIPAGVSAGNYMTLENHGNVGINRGQPGNLIIIFDEKEHDRFTRQGDNIVCQMPISFTLAALGGEVMIPTLNGSRKIKIPSGTQSGRVFRLKGKGIPHLNSYGSGDELIQVMVWTPTKLSSEDKRILSQLNQSTSFVPPRTDKSFLQKLKESLGI
ncbi:MAG TPA: molecular chaperone DnaJ [candidate division Zixibacteria bacterium]|nr:molecular chaperone DnaJ [candidate division Zixibacteria bacterium]